MNNNIYITLVSFLILNLTLQSQEVVAISKAEVLSKVSENNTSIKISEEEFKQARADYRQTNAVFLPNISVSHTAIATTNPLMAFGSKLNQEILTQSDFNPAMLNDPYQIESFATMLEIQQPLLNLDGIYQRKAAKSKMDAMALKTERTQDYLAFEVNKAYMQLQLAYRSVDVWLQALKTVRENKKMVDNRFKQGYLQRVDVLNMEVRLTEVENQLQAARSQAQNASNYISFLMNDKSFVIYKPSDDLVLAGSTTYFNAVPESRADIRAMAMASQAYEAINKADKMDFLPTLNAFGNYQLYDDQIFQGDANGYLFGATLSWDIFNGSKRFGKVQKSKAEYEKSKLEYQQYLSKSNLELNKAKRSFSDAESKLRLTALAMQQSEESLRIRRNRFEEGLEKTSDLLQAETQYAQKQLSYYQTIYEYNYVQSYLQFLTKE